MVQTDWPTISGMIIAGHGVASGIATDSPYPKSTIELQTPFFQARGLDLRPYFPGTLNVSIAPHQFEIKCPLYTFAAVNWTPAHPPETFSFCQCWLQFQGDRFQGLIYYPHPETKRIHFQAASVLEVLMPKIGNIHYGDSVLLAMPSEQIGIHHQ